MKKKFKISIVLLFLILLFLFFPIKSLAKSKTREDSLHSFVEQYSEDNLEINQLTIPFDSKEIGRAHV